ncbi:MAG: hypothetical protein JNL90_10740 [Planctomycetes bacterium]|nr:hypothetical protein [Planctomycetota bacterium]
MSPSRGPLRVVLIRSGGYDYAELDLSAPVHLVAANNVGKTTLIAALQFLYIDDQRQMHFSHGASETRQHYFPHAGSFVLFECMTPTGFQILGLRGLGPVQGYEFERFVCTGTFDRDDFFDGQQTRPWEEIKRRLIARNLTLLKPQELRSSLIGATEGGGAALGLVPLRRSGSFESFRFLFRNLLRLSKIEQDQLKRLFIDITRPLLRKVEVDLKHDYSELFARVERQAADVDALKRVAPSIAEYVKLHGEREVVRGRLVCLWTAVEAALASLVERTARARADLDAERRQLLDHKAALDDDLITAQARARSIAQQQGALRVELKGMEALRDRARSFVPEIETALRSSLAGDRDALVARIAQATPASRREVEERVAGLKRQIESDCRLVARYADAVVNWLRAKTGLTDPELANVFRVINPALLSEIVAEGHVTISDPETLLQTIRALHRGFDASGYRGSGVSLPRDVLAPDSPLARYQDIESIRQRLQSARDAVLKDERLLADIEGRERLFSERAAVEERLKSAEARLRDWESWQQTAPRLPEVQTQLAALEEEAASCQAGTQDLQGRLTALALQQQSIAGREKEVGDCLSQKIAEVQRLPRPSLDWPKGSTPTEGEAAALDSLIPAFRAMSTEQRRLADDAALLSAKVETETAGRHLGATESETVDRLKDELAALENRTRAVHDLWKSLVDDMRNAFKALVDGVDQVRREVSRLTQSLNRRQISNLERVELELVKQHDLLRRLEAVVVTEEAPLFGGADGRSRAARDIASCLSERPRIELAELFDLHFKVVDRTGKTKTFDTLTQIESQGTSITIKVLVHLELLKMMLSDEPVAVPFFLDEVATLDDDNLRALIDHALGMGFVPIVASPDARDCVDTLYFLRPGKGGLVLDETSRVIIRRAADHGA